nr:unnamed protein product [Spirometra erinaceieuropaei]
MPRYGPIETRSLLAIDEFKGIPGSPSVVQMVSFAAAAAAAAAAATTTTITTTTIIIIVVIIGRALLTCLKCSGPTLGAHRPNAQVSRALNMWLCAPTELESESRGLVPESARKMAKERKYKESSLSCTQYFLIYDNCSIIFTGPGRPAHNAYPLTCSGEPISPTELDRRQAELQEKRRARQAQRLKQQIARRRRGGVDLGRSGVLWNTTSRRLTGLLPRCQDGAHRTLYATNAICPLFCARQKTELVSSVLFPYAPHSPTAPASCRLISNPKPAEPPLTSPGKTPSIGSPHRYERLQSRPSFFIDCLLSND